MIKKLLKRSNDLQRLNDCWKAFRQKRRRPRQIKSYFASRPNPRLHLGCGDNILPGWLNTDQSNYNPSLIYLDITKVFPLPDSTFDFVLAEHVIEHIARRDAVHMLSECHRVLKPGGTLRVATPDLQRYLSLYGQSSPSEFDQECVRAICDDWIFPGFHKAEGYKPSTHNYAPVFVVNDIFMNYEHRFIFDEPLLRSMCADAGFSQCIRCTAGKSTHPELNGIETHIDKINAHLTLTLESTKAGTS